MPSRIPRRPVAALLAALALAVCAAPAAAQSPFNNLPASPSTPTTTTVAPAPSTSTTNSSGVQDWWAIVGVAVGIIAITAIGLYIARDARRRAPITSGEAEAAHLDPDAHRRGHQAKQRARAKAKAARDARRRNR